MCFKIKDEGLIEKKLPFINIILENITKINLKKKMELLFGVSNELATIRVRFSKNQL